MLKGIKSEYLDILRICKLWEVLSTAFGNLAKSEGRTDFLFSPMLLLDGAQLALKPVPANFVREYALAVLGQVIDAFSEDAVQVLVNAVPFHEWENGEGLTANLYEPQRFQVTWRASMKPRSEEPDWRNCREWHPEKSGYYWRFTGGQNQPYEIEYVSVVSGKAYIRSAFIDWTYGIKWDDQASGTLWWPEVIPIPELK